jgi:uncharacterized protein
MSDLLPRFATRRIHAAMADTPAVLVNGPRQCGKTTLVQALAMPSRPYLTLDDPTTLAAATSDPVQFLRGLDGAIIDEVQRAPALLRTLKLLIDQDRRPGRFILTGSADLLALPTVAESLAGRMEVITLLPLSWPERLRAVSVFLPRAFDGKLAGPAQPLGGSDLVDRVLEGGYPEMIQRSDPQRRRAWARAYVNGILQRDVRDLGEVSRLDAMPRLLRMLAAHATQLTNFSGLGAPIMLDDKTTRRYTGLLEQCFLVRRVEPWFSNDLKRLVKTPKTHFLDAGLLAALRGVGAPAIARDRTAFGPLLETWVFAELLKLVHETDDDLRLAFHRTRDGEEVDFVIEHPDGGLIAIEVKAAASASAADFKGLRHLQQACGDALRLGVLLYDGDTAVPFGPRLWAAPFGHLFATDPEPSSADPGVRN